MDEKTLRERLAENVGPVERAALKAHGERGALIEVGPELDLLDVAEAIAALDAVDYVVITVGSFDVIVEE